MSVVVATYPGGVKEFVVYSLLRLVLFIAAFSLVAGVWALFDDSLPLILVLIVALVVSGIASYFLLNRPREALARRVEARASAASSAFERRKAREDVD